MSDANHSMTTIKVKIFLPVFIPNMTALAFYYIDIE